MEAIPTQSTRPIVKTLRIVPAKSLVVSALPTTPSEIKTGSDDSRDGRSGRSTQASQTPSTANLSSANPLSSATNQSIPNLASLILQSPRVREDRNSRGIEVESSQAPTKSSTSAETSLSRAESITRASSSGRSFTRTGAESIPDSRTISSETSRVRSDVNDEIGTDARSPQDPISTRSRQYKATEPEHAPVLGRKRKTKKVKSNVNSPLVSRAPSPTPSNMDRFNDLGDDDAAVDLSPGLVERQSASVTPSIPSPAVTKDLHVAEEDDPVNPVASKEGPVQTVLEQMVKMGHVTSEQLLKLFSMPSQGAKVNFDEEAYLERRVYDSPIAEQIRIMEEGRPPTGLAGDSMPRVRADKIYPEQLIWMFDGEVTRFLQLSKQVWEGANHGGWNPEVGSSSTARDHAHGRETPAPTTRTADSRDVLPSFDQLSTEPGAYPTRTTDDAYKVVAASMEELARGGKLPHFMKQLHQHKAVSAAMKKETGQVNGRPFAELTLDEQDEELRRLEVRMAEAKREEMRSLKELEKLSRKNRKLIQEVLSV